MTVTVPATTAARWLRSFAGVQSHHRSLLIWPDLVADADWPDVRLLLHTGARILSLGRPMPEAESAVLPAVELQVWGGSAPARPAGASAGGPDTSTARPGEWRDLTALWEQAGLTPLPPTARLDPVWSHARLRRAGCLVASASVQHLAAPLGSSGARLLTCSVACDSAERRTGAARQCVQALIARRGEAAALIEPGTGSELFFARLGWQPVGSAYLYRYR